MGRAYDDERGDEYGEKVEQEYVGIVELYGYVGDVIDGRIKGNEMEPVLEVAEEESSYVADDESLAYEHDGEGDEDASDGEVGGSERFECAYHVYLVEHDDEESADDGEDADAYHQNDNHDDVHVEHSKPREGVWCEFANAEYAVGYATMVGTVVDGKCHVEGYIVDPREVANGDFITARLVCRPSVETLHGGEVGDGVVGVVFGHVGLEDAADGEAPGTHRLVGEEVGKDAVALTELELAGCGLRQQELRYAVGRRTRHGTADERLMEECGVVVGRQALEGDAAEVGGGLEQSHLQCEGLDVVNIWKAADDAEEAVAGDDWQHLTVGVVGKGKELDVGGKACDFVGYLAFESKYDGEGYNHDGYTDGYACKGYANSRARKSLPALTVI